MEDDRRATDRAIAHVRAGHSAGMIGGFDDLPAKVQAWLLTFFSSPEEVDRWLRRPDTSCGCAPIQLLEAPPGLPALEDLIRAQRRAAASDDAADYRRSVGRDKQAG